ncbi:MAG: sigma-70 family RNA polymerase sigma factor [Pseudomonadota bacterium]
MKSSKFAIAVDSDTLTAVRSQDRAAQERVFRLFERPVFTLALRICQDEQDAMDVLQDTFVHAFSRIHQYRADAPFWGWLRQVAVNTCLGRLRKRKGGHLSLVGESEEVRQEHPDMQMDLAGALARLSPDGRAVVWLYDVEGYSHQEIADLYGRSVSFSKTQLSRAHGRLRELLNRDGGDALCPQIATP